MVMWRLLAALCCASTCVAIAQESPAKANMACVERLNVPTYPPLAEAARVEASITSAIRVGVNGEVQVVASDVRTKSETVRGAFLKSVDSALSGSKFAASCAGREVTIRFEFLLGEQTGKDRVSFTYPNRFTIYAPAKVIMGYNR